jgi:AraC-like DNA-binding protein
MFKVNLILIFLLIFILLKNHFDKNKGIVFAVAAILSIYVKIFAMTFPIADFEQNPIFLRIILLHGLIGFVPVPFLLLYLKSIFKKPKILKPYIILSSITLILAIIYYLPYFQLSISDKIQLFDNPNGQLANTRFFWFKYSVANIVSDIYNPFTGVVSISLLFLNLKRYQLSLSKKSYLSILQIGIMLIINFITISIISIFHYFFKELAHTETVGLLTMVMPLSIMAFPSYVYDNSINSDLTFYLRIMNRFSKEEKEDKLMNQELVLDTTRIINFLNQEKPYLSPDFSIHDIVKQLDIPQKRVTDCFSKVIKIPFPKLRNQMRVDYAIELFKTNAHANKSIFGVASDSGFKNRATFYNAFKEEKNMTPTDWINQGLNG